MNPHSIVQLMMGRWGHYLAIALIVVMSLAFLSSVTALSRFFLGTAPGTDAKEVVRTTPKKKDDFRRIVDSHLFGEYLPKDLAGDDVPKTILDLKLMGVMLAEPSQFSQVILKIPGGREKVYHEGDTIPGNARIVKILKDKVIIRRSGRVESIAFPQDKLIFHPSPKPMDMNNE